jgi:ATP-GRASP peptide maturase of grasp-with-spasm system
MILVLSDDQFQTSLDEVLLWLSHFNANFVRLNSFDYTELSEINVDFCDDSVEFQGKKIHFENINVVWHFRFGKKTDSSIEIVADEKLKGSESLIMNHLGKTNDIISQYFFSKLKSKAWFNLPSNSNVNKLYVLDIAQKVGLSIPKTIISNDKKKLKSFVIENDEDVITKPIWEVFSISKGTTYYASYTTKIFSSDPFFDDENESFPSMLQKNIVKRFEIRTFFIDNRFYSMAIFSQENEQTKQDFRVYDRKKPNRTIPYKLPTEIEEKLTQLLDILNLKTTSIDLIYSDKDEFVFLEVNPVGQFGMTSEPCNYNLEKEMALTLIKYDQ